VPTYNRAEIHALRTMIIAEMSDPSCERFGDIDQAYIDLVSHTDPFEWQQWSKGLQGLQNAGASVFDGVEIHDADVTSDSFVEFDAEELVKLLLMIHRVNRFVDGFYDQQISSGVVLKILDQLIAKLDPRHKTQ
jgi:hypothetical protein